MVIKDADYYLARYDSKAITLVEQDYTSCNGQEMRAEVWNLCKRLVVHPQNEPLPEIHKKVKGLDLSFSKTKMKTQLKDWIDEPTSFWAPNRENFPLLSHVGAESGASREQALQTKQSSRSQDFLHMFGGGKWTRRH